MPNFLEGLPKEKVQLLYILGAAKAELTEQQFYQCAYESTGMNWFSFHDVVGDLEENGEGTPRHPGIVSCRFPGVDSEEMVVRLDRAGICASPGAACSAGKGKPSHVLLAMGLGQERAKESVRFSFGRLTTPEEAETAAHAAAEIYKRAVRPLEDTPTVR